MFSKILKSALQHKFISGIILLLLIVSGYFGYKSIFGTNAVIRYVSGQIQKGTLIISVSGNGQVSVSNQVDIKPKVSGEIIYVGVKNGQEVGAGTLIVQLDARDAQKAVRDAEANLESVKLSLEKLKKPADTLSILQAENSLSQAKESKQNAEDDLKKAYDDGFNTVANAFLDLPTIITGLYDMLYSSDVGLGGAGQWNIDFYSGSAGRYDEKAPQYKEETRLAYEKAREDYDRNFANYKAISRYSAPADIERLINETYDTTKTAAEAIKNANNLIQFYKDKLTERNFKPQALSDTHLSTLNTYTAKTNTHLLNLLGVKNDIKNERDTIVNSDRSIAEKTESLAKLKAGADALDIQSSELAVKQRENALFDAKEKLADYFVRAPFDGIIAKLDAKKGDSASAITIIATIITRKRLAEISLNEIDMVKIKVGQKAAVTFDAIEDLSITAEVAEIDSVGTVNQGVVTYGVKIGFDTQDERVKPGMSVSAAIITDAKQDVLLAPNSGVKQQNNATYAEMFVGKTQTPRRQNIQTGLSNDTETEIISGLNEGDKIVTQTIAADASQSQTQQNAGLRIPGITGGGGNQMRMR